jgi:segregation and condensation protein B
MTPDPIGIIEALLFASDSPLETERIQELLELRDAAEAHTLVEALRSRYDAESRPLQIVQAAGGYRMVTRPELAPWLVRLARSRTRSRLSRPALETLAVIAYRQPISRPEIESVRGVNSEGVLDHLLERRMIRISGRKDAPGRPFLYETTREFLVAFGLGGLSDLPRVEGDLSVSPGPSEPGAATRESQSGSPSPQNEEPPLENPGRSRAGLSTGE